MRALFIVLAILLFASTAQADVIFDNGPPPFRPRPRPRREVPVVTPTVPDFEPVHGDFEIDIPEPDTSDDSAGFVILFMLGGLAFLLASRRDQLEG